MKGTYLRLTPLLCSILIVISPHAMATESIRWLAFDYPPFEIVSGADAGTGGTDEMRRFAQKGLPNYDHRAPSVVNQARLERLFKEQLSCHAALIPEKDSDSFAYYSIPYGMAFPFVFVTSKKKHQSLFNNAKTISLIKALTVLDASLTIPSRNLGPVIDPMIKENKGSSNLSIRMSTTSAGNAFEMLLKNRTDYVISYINEAIYWGRNNNSLDQLVFMEIEEVKDKFVVGSAACSRNRKGKAIIKALNTYLLKTRSNKEYIKKAFLDWTPEELHADFLNAYENMILQDTFSNTTTLPPLD